MKSFLVGSWGRWLGPCLLLIGTTSLSGTTILPPTFETLVSRADRVLHARVIGQESFRDSFEGQPFVRTDVTVEVIETIAGEPAGEKVVLEFLGGQAGGLIMRIDGMPKFVAGDEVILFERGNGRTVCPLVSWQYGQYRVAREADGAFPQVSRADRTLLRTVAQVSEPLFHHVNDVHAAEAKGEPMTLVAFKTAIRSAWSKGGRDE